jgi:hypothetical protein
MISTKDKKSPTTMPKRLTGNSLTPLKGPIGRITDFRKDPVSFLQRQLGNSFLQAKLKVSQPNDKYEQEADRIANLVMQMPEPEVLRQPEEEEEEELIQSKPLVEQITPLVQRQIEEEEEEEELLQTKLETDAKHSVQRQAEEEEEEFLQTKKGAGHGGAVNSDVEARINKLKGGGKPLSASARAFFEPRFGQGFSQVRVHTDTGAAELAGVFKARAFTLGQNVIFGAGQYIPESPAGRRLIAHELTHVLQQTSTRPDQKSVQMKFLGSVKEVGERSLVNIVAYDVKSWRLHLKSADEWDKALALNAFMAKAVGHSVYYKSADPKIRNQQEVMLRSLEPPSQKEEQSLIIALLSTEGIDLREIGAASPVTAYLLSKFIKKNYISTIDWLNDLMFEPGGFRKFAIKPSRVQEFLAQAGGTFSDLKELRKGELHGTRIGYTYIYDPDIRHVIGLPIGSEEVERPRVILQAQAIAGAMRTVAEALNHASKYEMPAKAAIKYARKVENHAMVLSGVVKEIGRLEKIREELISAAVGIGFGALGTIVSKNYKPLAEAIEKSVAWDVGTSATLEFVKDRAVSLSKGLTGLSASKLREKMSESFRIEVGECVNKALQGAGQKQGDQIRIVRLEMKNAFQLQ